jgi:hypothetical protein
VTLSQFHDELSTAAPGFWILIHRGFLAADRVADKQLYALHRSVRSLHRKGRIGLAQRRHGPFDYSYFVITR